MPENQKAKESGLINTQDSYSQKHGNQSAIVSRLILLLSIGMYLVLSGCARQLTPYGKARQADTIEAYEEFVRNNPRDPRVRFARDRIEVLRLLEAHRSGNATLAAPNGTAYEQRVADRSAPVNVRQGPWNLTASLPRSSAFTLDLYHGDIDPVPHILRIDQEGELIRYTLQYGARPQYYLTAIVPFDSFRRLWAAVIASDVGLYRASYGGATSTADYRGNFVIEADTGTQRLSRTIRLDGLNFEDQYLVDLIKAMIQMHPGDHSMNFFR